MSERDIQGNFLALRNIAKELAGADLPEKERQTVQLLVDVGLNLLEGLLIDINKIAEAAEFTARQNR